MEDQAESWFRRRTSHWQDWPLDKLLRWKASQGVRVSVVIPARDEEATVGGVAGAIAGAFLPCGLVDELVVMDSDSTDRTAEVATAAGATVHRSRDVAAGLGAYPGKGEALWKSLLVTTGDILVFVDADLTRWGKHFVTGLLGPLLDPAVPTLQVQACYDRAVDVPVGGGPVTELVARPLLNLWWPELALVAQPLAGEWAASRSLLETLPIPVGYGVELAVLIDTARRNGTGASPRSTWESGRTGTSQTRTSRSWRPNYCLSPSEGACPAPMSHASGPASSGPPERDCASSSARTARCERGCGQCHVRNGLRSAR
jgi:glucosyl-3-phosphoglycerate synthase